MSTTKRLTPMQLAMLKVRSSTSIRDAQKATTYEKRSAKAKALQHAVQWKQVTEPLRAELQRVHGSIKYEAGPERDEALAAYQEVLLTLRDRLKAYARPLGAEPQTPLHAAQAKNLPNEGVHWTDWVPLKIRNRIEALFAAIPYKRQARVFEPFKRIIPKGQHAKQESALRKGMHLVKDRLQSIYTIKKDEETLEKIKALNLALLRLDALPPDAPVPRDWRKLAGPSAQTGSKGGKSTGVNEGDGHD